ncbi:MAG: barstar family protein [Tannerellaceae bacterium]|nr:barstar family protein [Tannerellaceae bacterium]
MAKTCIIDGSRIQDIPSFYKEVNRVFMSNEDWKLGESLDALSDMLYGGYGEIEGKEEIHLIWKEFEKNRTDLGVELTKNYYRNKLKSPSTFNIEFVQQKLDELEKGRGKTYFDMILEIISEHPNIKLITFEK